MDETGMIRFPGNLDPRAEEFRPRYRIPNSHVTHVTNIPTVYYPYAPHPPPLLPPYCYPDGGIGYAHVATSPSYVAPVAPPSAAPTRTLALSSVAYTASETAVRRELERFGEVRCVEMERLEDGIVTVHFYDLRHAQCALREIREQHMNQQTRLRSHYGALLSNAAALAPQPPPARGLISGCVVWAQYVVPACHVIPDGHNQGTIVIFNLSPDVTTSFLRETFEAFGPVKELRETPLKKHQRFVEFYDVRDAAKALRAMNEKEINGRTVVIEFSRPGGHNRRYYGAAANIPADNHHHQYSSNRIPKFSGRPASSNSSSPRSHSSGNQKSSPNSNRSLSKSTIEPVNRGGASNRIDEKSPPARRNFQKIHGIVTVTSKQNKIRPWKGERHGKKKLDTWFLITEDSSPAESNITDQRTTVMIKNIPNKYSQKLVLNMLDNHCIHCNEQIADGEPLSAYDFVYLPIDFNNKCNVGYGFVNMTSPEATLRLYKSFHNQHWEVFNSRKICEVTYARVQGLEALKEHFKNSKFPCEMEHYLPVVFAPPRDGKLLTEPVAVVGQPVDLSGLQISDDSVSDSGNVGPTSSHVEMAT